MGKLWARVSSLEMRGCIPHSLWTQKEKAVSVWTSWFAAKESAGLTSKGSWQQGSGPDLPGYTQSQWRA